MKRQLITNIPEAVPAVFLPYLKDTPVYDSSCSREARVYFLDKGHGLYLKKAPKGTLKEEASMWEFYHKNGLSTEILGYESAEWDWMLTERARGEDCTDPMYMRDPKRLCDKTAQLLRMLHSTPVHGCPVAGRTASCLATAAENYENHIYDQSLFPDNWGYASAREAWEVIRQTGALLQTDTLLHGDYCLPNIILDNWQFSGFIDLDAAGIGDKHVDLFWGIWSLNFNLKTDRYRERFLDAYGRDGIQEELLRTVAAIEVFK